MKLENIVVGYDGSDDAQAALGAAADLAGDTTKIHVVVAYEPVSAAEVAKFMDLVPDEFKTSFDVLDSSRGQLRDAEMLLDRRGVDHDGRLVEGKPAAAILDAAEELSAELIVVGSRGRGPVTRFVRGSVSSRVANHAPCSFMIVHERAPS